VLCALAVAAAVDLLCVAATAAPPPALVVLAAPLTALVRPAGRSLATRISSGPQICCGLGPVRQRGHAGAHSPE
jgi:hypothetical protein